ncbi:hypothetical protein Tfer_1171 [Thermincola ferriacetica]|uniref:Group 1 glycosyl transferase n=1 Tax=Thermincola ferriacetica TaxID=281456 RepID=A0A0L6W3J2_9FIRM|nr:glycosyltransferase [Thermincola ferriacetica]KNZ70031.1 hypothetical protein Tfer_1171 [Thermincola ferriacetica]
MKILYLVHQFFPEYCSGTEKFVLNLATMMQRMGNKVKVITYSFYEDSFYDEIVGNILVKEFTYKGIPIKAFKYRQSPVDTHYALENKDLSQVADNFINDEGPDLVHIGHPMRVGELIRATNRLEIPYVITLTDFFLMCPKVVLSTSEGQLCTGPERGSICIDMCNEIPNSLIQQRLKSAEEILFNAKKVVAPSEFLANLFKKEFPAIEFEVVNHGISFSKRKKNRKRYTKEDGLVFCYAGTLAPHKGVHILIEAFKNIASPKAGLEIYGSGPDKLYIKKLMDLAEKDVRIKFCGQYWEDNVGNIFTNVDVVIVPSLCYESYSLVMHEAFSCNVPVIASSIGNLGEKIIDNFNGFTFKPGDSSYLTKLLYSLIKNPERLNELKVNLRYGIVPSVEQEAYAYERIYRQVINYKTYDIKKGGFNGEIS